jgi:hypothetical protein
MLFEGLSRITSNYVAWCMVYEGCLGKWVFRCFIDYDALHACLGSSCGLTSRRFYEVNESVLRNRIHYQLVSCKTFLAHFLQVIFLQFYCLSFQQPMRH